jgi:hypothetical protein
MVGAQCSDYAFLAQGPRSVDHQLPNGRLWAYVGVCGRMKGSLHIECHLACMRLRALPKVASAAIEKDALASIRGDGRR